MINSFDNVFRRNTVLNDFKISEYTTLSVYA